MIIKVVAILCRLAAPNDCHDEVVTTSDLSNVNPKWCQVGMPQLAAFMATRPVYFLKRWRCDGGGDKEHA